MRRQTSQGLGMLFVALLAWSGVASAENPWRPAPTPPRSFRAGSVALQLTDGTIMVQEDSTSKWWKLTPDQNADYDTGTWSELARSVGFGALDEIVDYAPSFFASAVLPDGRVIVIGGEYLAGVKVETNMGAIFDPTAGPKGSWTPVHPPTGWGRIGDAASVVLPYLF